MHRITGTEKRNVSEPTCKCLINFCWIVGLLTGIVAAAGAGDSFFSLMRGRDVSPVSIVGLLITFLPFLFTAFAVYLPAPVLLIPTVLAKAFLYGFCLFAITLSYGDGAWLVQLLLLFADVGSTVLLMLLWLRHGDGPEMPPVLFGSVLAAALALKALDICVVMPFWALLP